MVTEEMAWIRVHKDASTPAGAQAGTKSVSADDLLVSFGGRIRPSTRRRMRMFAAAHDREIQDMLEEALVEYLDRRGG